MPTYARIKKSILKQHYYAIISSLINIIIIVFLIISLFLLLFFPYVPSSVIETKSGERVFWCCLKKSRMIRNFRGGRGTEEEFDQKKFIKKQHKFGMAFTFICHIIELSQWRLLFSAKVFMAFLAGKKQ